MAFCDAPFGLSHFIQMYKETDTFERKYGSRVYLVPVSTKMKGKIGNIKVKVTLEHTTKAQGEVALYLYSFFNLGARVRLVVKATPRPLYPRERPGTHCTGGWVGLTTCLVGCEKFRPLTGIRSLDRPARSESLYWLSYPSPWYSSVYYEF
jgi:hypothetical protein